MLCRARGGQRRVGESAIRMDRECPLCGLCASGVLHPLSPFHPFSLVCVWILVLLAAVVSKSVR